MTERIEGDVNNANQTSETNSGTVPVPPPDHSPNNLWAKHADAQSKIVDDLETKDAITKGFAQKLRELGTVLTGGKK